MSEEFQESEVVFQENFEPHEDNEECDLQLHYNNPKECRPKRKKLKSKKNSVPMNIPENASGNNAWIQYVDSDYFEDEDREMEPPHVIIGRRIAGKMMAFSVCKGKGRTLKGRDLSEVRNSILRLTGFLET